MFLFCLELYFWGARCRSTCAVAYFEQAPIICGGKAGSNREKCIAHIPAIFKYSSYAPFALDTGTYSVAIQFGGQLMCVSFCSPPLLLLLLLMTAVKPEVSDEPPSSSKRRRSPPTSPVPSPSPAPQKMPLSRSTGSDESIDYSSSILSPPSESIGTRSRLDSVDLPPSTTSSVSKSKSEEPKDEDPPSKRPTRPWEL